MVSSHPDFLVNNPGSNLKFSSSNFGLQGLSCSKLLCCRELWWYWLRYTKGSFRKAL